MSAPVDVLAVMDKDRVDAYASRHPRYRERMHKQSKAARDAVTKLLRIAQTIAASDVMSESQYEELCDALRACGVEL